MLNSSLVTPLVWPCSFCHGGIAVFIDHHPSGFVVLQRAQPLEAGAGRRMLPLACTEVRQTMTAWLRAMTAITSVQILGQGRPVPSCDCLSTSSCPGGTVFILVLVHLLETS